jgi:hypothetical protein
VPATTGRGRTIGGANKKPADMTPAGKRGGMMEILEYNGNCALCDRSIMQSKTGEPCLAYKNKHVCFDCYMDLAEKIYDMAGMGDGGLIHIIYHECLKSRHNRARRIPISQYKKVLKLLLHKYNFQCVACRSTDNLTIDHIKPVSRGGTDEMNNLQILCKSCNSKKGSKIMWEA